VNVRRPEAAELQTVLELVRAHDEAVYRESDWTENDLREEWAKAELERDAWLVELDGRVAGYAILEVRRDGSLVADGYVHPGARERGIGTELLRLTEARALAEVAPGETRPLRNATLAGDACTPNLYSTHGYAPVRHFWKMVVDLDDSLSQPEIDGIEIDRYRHPADGGAVHAARNEAFAQEWGFRPPSFAEFEERELGAARFDPRLWWVARDGDELAGFVMCDWKRHGDWGWVASLGVREPWRRRGIGEALLRAAFGEFARRGERRVALGVDAENPTGATRLYERVGMRVIWAAVVYEKELRRG